MPYWTIKEEQQLRELVEQGKSIQELSSVFNRSPEALIMKLKRMSLSVPPREKSSAKNAENKVTTSATTTTPKLEPIEFEELPSPNMAMGLLWAAVRRLQEPDVGREEAKKLRLILQGVKSYIHLDADYVMRIRHVETGMLIQNQFIVSHLKYLIDHAKTPEDKAKLEQQLRDTEQHIKGMIDMGIKAPKTAQESKLT